MPVSRAALDLTDSPSTVMGGHSRRRGSCLGHTGGSGNPLLREHQSAAKRAHEFFPRTFAKNNPSQISRSMRQGMRLCAMSASPPRRRNLFRRAIFANIKRTIWKPCSPRFAPDSRNPGHDGMERARQKIPCALLETHMCSVPGARPAACRASPRHR